MLGRLSGLIKLLLLLVWLLILLAAGAEFAQQNQQLVQLKLLLWNLPEASAGVVFTLTLTLGVALGLMAFLPGFIYVKLKLRKAQRQISTLEAGAVTVLPKVD